MAAFAVKCLVDISQMLIRNMRVYLRRCNVGVPKKRLDTSQVGAILQKVGGKAVTDGVRRHSF